MARECESSGNLENCFSFKPEKWITYLENALTTESLFVHYDTKLPLVISADTSDYGIRAVI
ncbi:K02A2.6-like [Cordylochernes scorpioides]|uniref:K02A2.6-like n=1 Tax=Cordylochernes scorpioides TaxID=51811 RepID=A0ABY6LS13_9ARAC|nr:K02A2.6-like [Cordylochernes scorpioides]